MRKIHLFLAITSLVTVFSCRDDLSEILVTQKERDAQLSPGVCALVTLTNKLETNRVNNPDKSYRKVDMISFDFSYQITASEGAPAEYFKFILGSDRITVEKVTYNKVCVAWDSEGDCTSTENEKEYQTVLPYGSTKVVEAEFTGLLDLTTQVPSGLNYEISNIWAETRDEAKVFQGLNYISSSKLDCYKSHIVTLYNARLAPSDAARTSGTTEDSINASVVSTNLLTKAEQKEFTTASVYRREQLGAVATERARELKTYLIAEAKDNSYVDYAMAKIKANLNAKANNRSVEEQQILEVFPSAKTILGDELASEFARSVVKAMAFQNSL
ncbi:MAG: hypothetical protein JNM93_13040 [Bacteriovoracaceae bacterium]|nr:hypothetical protein [Bacteriovoracaceae bacterium]